MGWVSGACGFALQSALPVDRFVVSFRRHHFGRQVVGSSAERPGNIRHLFCEPKIRDTKVAVAIEQKVLGLEIAIDDVERMEIVERQCHLCCIELGDGVWEALRGRASVSQPVCRSRRATHLRFPQQAKQLTALDKVHDHVQVLRVGKGAPEGDEEGVFDAGEHAPLVVGVLDLLHLDNLSLFQHLDGVEALVVLGLDEVHTAEAARAERSLKVEVAQGIFALCRLCVALHGPGAIGHGADAALLAAVDGRLTLLGSGWIDALVAVC